MSTHGHPRVASSRSGSTSPLATFSDAQQMPTHTPPRTTGPSVRWRPPASADAAGLDGAALQEAVFSTDSSPGSSESSPGSWSRRTTPRAAAARGSAGWGPASPMTAPPREQPEPPTPRTALRLVAAAVVAPRRTYPVVPPPAPQPQPPTPRGGPCCCGARPRRADAVGGTIGVPVRLHVYDFSITRRVAAINAVSRAVTSCGGVLGDGVGAFHGGIEVHGVEWSYGSTASGEATGIFGCAPRRSSSHSYRSTVELGRCMISKSGVDRLLTAMARICEDGEEVKLMNFVF